jgi:hypothetical protein
MNAKRNILALFAIGLILQFCMALPVMSAAKYADSTTFNPVPIPVNAKNAGGGVPVGTIISWPSATNPEDPDNWLECNGQSFSPAVYPELSSAMGKATVPDFRGLFLRGYGSQSHAQENGSTVGVTSTLHASGSLGTVQGDASRNIYGTFPIETENYQQNWNRFSGAFYLVKFGQTNDGEFGQDAEPEHTFGFDASRVVPTADETRPVNTAVRYLIRALP